jgi:hypothetical protein
MDKTTILKSGQDTPIRGVSMSSFLACPYLSTFLSILCPYFLEGEIDHAYTSTEARARKKT